MQFSLSKAGFGPELIELLAMLKNHHRKCPDLSSLFLTHQRVETGFVIVTQDSEGGTVDIHNRRPVVLQPEDAWRWMDSETPVEEAAHIAQSRSLPTQEFMWWRVSRELNRADPYNDRKELLEPVSAPENA